MSRGCSRTNKQREDNNNHGQPYTARDVNQDSIKGGWRCSVTQPTAKHTIETTQPCESCEGCATNKRSPERKHASQRATLSATRTGLDYADESMCDVSCPEDRCAYHTHNFRDLCSSRCD